MTTPVLFKEYIWLVNTIYQARSITLEDINRKWIQTDMSGGVEIARSTFCRHKDAIEDIFGIFIECDRKNGYQYYIGNVNVLSEDSIQNWMLSTLSVNHVISESLSLQKRILLEPIPSAKGYLEQIIEAMKKKRLVTILYRKYGTDETKEHLIAPYCIKLYHRRWYLLGRYETGEFRVLSFDRIKELSITQNTFDLDEDFDAEAYFSECYGVVNIEELPVERIVLRAYGDESDYLRDLPIHHSQVEINCSNGYSDYEYYLRPTLDFCGQILSRGNRLQVIKPQSLVDKIHQMLADALKNYEQK
ncbi:MAG: WYL domain-containing protein [Prevotella sp.]|nr:WYL domain-containing protein [Prevotella sp.]